MANFSKQWCELNDNAMDWDFDILEIVENLLPGTHVPIICEGFGFVGIGITPENEVVLAMPVPPQEGDEEEYIKWESYADVVK